MTLSNEDERKLILLIKDSDESAFQQLYNQYRDKIASFAYRFFKSQDNAEEIVQETFIRFWQSRHKLDHSLTAAPLIFTIARRLILNELRQMAKSEQVIAHLWHKTQAIDHLSQNVLIAKEIDEKSKEALAYLSPQQKAIFCMSRYQGLTHEEIAHNLQISPHTVNNHLVEGLKKIRNYLLRYGLLHLFIYFCYGPITSWL